MVRTKRGTSVLGRDRHEFEVAFGVVVGGANDLWNGGGHKSNLLFDQTAAHLLGRRNGVVARNREPEPELELDAEQGSVNSWPWDCGVHVLRERG